MNQERRKHLLFQNFSTICCQKPIKNNILQKLFSTSAIVKIHR